MQIAKKLIPFNVNVLSIICMKCHLKYYTLLVCEMPFWEKQRFSPLENAIIVGSVLFKISISELFSISR